MMIIKHFEELKVYQIAIQLAKEIDQWSKTIPFYWRIKDIQQIRTSSSSVPSNIAEGFGSRFYPKKYLNYLTNGLGSSDETQSHLRLLHAQGYMSEEYFLDHLKRYKNLSVRLLNFINYLRDRHNIRVY